MEKKIRDFHIRTDCETHKLIQAAAKKDGLLISELLHKIVSDYVNKDINIQSALLASNNKLISDVRKLQQETVILYNMVHSFVYTFLSAFPEQCSWEMEQKGSLRYTKEVEVRQKAADKLMHQWQQKLFASRQMIQANLAEVEGKINTERTS